MFQVTVVSSTRCSHTVLRTPRVRGLAANRVCSGSRNLVARAMHTQKFVENGMPRDSVIGVLGGGQLGRMLALAAGNLGLTIKVLDPTTPDCPAATAAEQVFGSFQDPSAVRDFAAGVDLLTVEIEHVDVAAIQEVCKNTGVPVLPNPEIISIIQDKYRQKLHFLEAGVPVVDFMEVVNESQAQAAGEVFGYPYMLKSKRDAYDGRGNAVVQDEKSLKAAVASLGGFEMDLYAEKWAPFVKELAVMVARSSSGEVKSYPLVETIQKDSICFITEAPADLATDISKAASEVAEQAITSLDSAGIFGVEMFLLSDGSVMLNEVAPRPHNSGHYSMDSCATSQFEQHLRAVMGWPLGDTTLLSGAAIMYNIIGEEDGEPGMQLAHVVMNRALVTPGANIHWYGKSECRMKRKMGHINIVGKTRTEARHRLNLVAAGASDTLVRTGEATQSAGLFKPSHAEVAIIMGSDSDLPTMSAAAQVLTDFGVGCEVTVVSAHRTPDRMLAFAREAHKRGIRVIIAGAGGAAHLPGMVAALTPLPVIGVPVTPVGAHTDGLDALLSIVQMPRGVPVATVAIGNAANAGLLAVRMLGTSSADLQESMLDFQATQCDIVEGKAARLESIGWQKYLEKRP